MRSRLIRAVLIALLVSGGVLFYRTTLRPDPKRLEVWAEAALREIFGPTVTHGKVEADVLEGVRIRDLEVLIPGTEEPGLRAESIEIRHDVLALSAGVLRLQRIVIRGPEISAHETETGEIALDFPFDPPKDSGSKTTTPPILVVDQGTFRLTASASSKKFRPGYVLVLENFHAEAHPDPDGSLHIDGGFAPRGIGMAPGEEITFRGMANLEKKILDAYALWDRLRLTPEVKAILAPDLLAKLESQRLVEGPHQLGVHFALDPEVEAGRLRVIPQFKGTARMNIGEFPGAEKIDARTRDQINELFGKIALTVEVSGNRIDIRQLTTSLAGGEVRATGRVEDGGEVVDLDLEITGLRLDDPALLKALGPISDKVLKEFRFSGGADARISLRRARGGPFLWDASIDLVDATLQVLGREDPVKRTPSGNPLHYGFPYAIEHATGRIYASPEGVRLDAIEGRHGAATIRVRGATEKSRTGGPTGYVRWKDGDSEVLLTVEGRGIPVDADLEAAVEGSEFAGFLDRYRPSGVIDRIVLDIVKRPLLDDAAVVELDLDLDHDGFRYGPLPIPLEDVKGRVTLVRPVLESGERGKEFHVRAMAKGAGGAMTITADLLETARRGRVKVDAIGILIDDALESVILGSEPGRGELGATWRFLTPRGRADVRTDLKAFEDPGPESWSVELHDASVRLGGVAEDTGLTVDEMVGKVSVVDSNISIEGVKGRIGGGTLTVGGTLAGGPLGAWDLSILADDLRITRGVLAVIELAAPCSKIFPPGMMIETGGRLDLDLHLKRVPEGDTCVFIAGIAVRDADLIARIGDLSMHVRGAFSVDGADVRLEGVTAEGEGVFIDIPKARIGPEGLEGALTMRLTDVEVNEAVLGLLPEELRATFADATKDRRLQATDLSAIVDEQGKMTIRGALGLKAAAKAPPGGSPRGLIEFSPLVVSAVDAKGDRDVRGTLRLKGVEMDVGTRLEEIEGLIEVASLRFGDRPAGSASMKLETVRVAGLLLRDLTMPLVWGDGILRAGPIAAGFYGGRLQGDILLHTNAPTALEGRLRTRGISLALLRQDMGGGPEITGRAFADLEFQSRSSSMRDFTASGSAGVREADLGNLPAVANLPALFGSIVPFSEKPKFERADVTFTIADEKIDARCISMAGPLFEMKGYGTMDFSGALDVTLTPQFIKSMVLPGALQVPGLGSFLNLFPEDSLYVVRITGDLSNAKPVLAPFPMIAKRRPAPAVPPTPFLGKPSRRIPSWFR